MPLPIPPPPANRDEPKRESRQSEQALPGLPTRAPQGLPQPPPPAQRPPAVQQPQARPARRDPLEGIDFSTTPLSSINLKKLGVDVASLPVFQARQGRPAAKNYVRELRLVKDDGNSRGPVVLDPETGRLFRKMPPSEFVGEDPVLLVEDFNADDLNAEAMNLLGHLQVTSSNEEKAILLAKRQKKAQQAAALRAAAETEQATQ